MASTIVQRGVARALVATRKIFRAGEPALASIFARRGVIKNPFEDRTDFERSISELSALSRKVLNEELIPAIFALIEESSRTRERTVRAYSKDTRGKTLEAKLIHASNELLRRMVRMIRDGYTRALSREAIFRNVRRAWASHYEVRRVIATELAAVINVRLYEDLKDDETARIVHSRAHAVPDICDEFTGIIDRTKRVILPPFHPFCMCYVTTSKVDNARLSKLRKDQ